MSAKRTIVPVLSMNVISNKHFPLSFTYTKKTKTGLERGKFETNIDCFQQCLLPL